MIGILKGIVDDVSSDSVILDVSGVGYIVYVNDKTKSKIETGRAYRFFIAQTVHESGSRLYGFLNKEEKDCADILTRVQGISYKSSLNIINIIDPGEIKSAILSGNHKLFRIPGIGEKLANRIVTELRDSIHKLSISAECIQNSSTIQDAVSILVNLGYNSKHVPLVVRNVFDLNPGLETVELVSLVLKRM